MVDPEAQGSDVAEDTEDQANQPGRLAGTLLLVRDLWRLIRGEDQRGRKLRWLLGLLRPYRIQVVLMMVALLIATAAALAPPYLAGQAIDNGIRADDAGALTLIVVMDGGRVVDRGTHDELLARSPLYAEIAEFGCEDVVFLQKDTEEREAVARL